ncbi:hypothetical protein SK128_018894 [Halocaridina rubra]|uniref:Uncharacterized protein n=1 Tax=Halocaridina rubra TaxID=373956 RepID=A0AAN9A3Z8_HALRR
MERLKSLLYIQEAERLNERKSEQVYPKCKGVPQDSFPVKETRSTEKDWESGINPTNVRSEKKEGRYD